MGHGWLRIDPARLDPNDILCGSGATKVHGLREAATHVDRRTSAVLAVLAGGEARVVAAAFGLEEAALERDVGEFVAAGRAALDLDLDAAATPPYQAVLAHELRTPLTIVQGWVELLRGSQLTATQRRAVEGLAAQAERLLRLSKDALDAAGVASGQLTLRLEPVDVAALVRRVTEGRRDEVAVEGPAEPVIVHADAERLGQVLDNLLDNARRYGAATDVTVRVTATGDHVQVAVDSPGEPLPPDIGEGLFEPYVRHRGVGGGSGLGLYVCRQLVAAHSGRIGAHPLPDGNRFWFTLPRPATGR